MRNFKINYRVLAGLVLWTAVAFVIGSTLAGCNMMAGLGQDITTAANGIRKEMSDE